MTFIGSVLQEQIHRAMQEAKTELRTGFVAIVNRKMVSLEAHVEAKVNETRQDTTSLLEDLKTTIAAICDTQEKMGQAMERMGNEL